MEEEEEEEEVVEISWLSMDRSSARAVCWRPHNQQHQINLFTFHFSEVGFGANFEPFKLLEEFLRSEKKKHGGFRPGQA